MLLEGQPRQRRDHLRRLRVPLMRLLEVPLRPAQVRRVHVERPQQREQVVRNLGVMRMLGRFHQQMLRLAAAERELQGQAMHRQTEVVFVHQERRIIHGRHERRMRAVVLAKQRVGGVGVKVVHKLNRAAVS